MDQDVSAADRPGGLGEELRALWERVDPAPPGLLERIAFALEVDAFSDGDLELELMRLQEQAAPATARGAGEPVRTVTFASESTTVVLAISDVEGGHRVDGWVAPGGRRAVEVRTATGTTREECDETGRFALPLVPPGHLQLVLSRGAPGEAAELAVVTPALTL